MTLSEPSQSFAAKDFNAVLEALARARLSGAEHRACWFLLRKTYGWHKAEDQLSIGQWAAGISSDRGNAQRIVEGLIARRVIVRRQVGRQTFAYGLNTAVASWDPQLFERDSSRARNFKRAVVAADSATVVEPDISLTPVEPDNCCREGHTTVVEPDTSPTPVEPDNCCREGHTTVVDPDTSPPPVEPDNCCRDVQPTVVQPGSAADVQPDNHKAIIKAINTKLPESAPAAAGAPPADPIPGLVRSREPPPEGVRFFREICGRWPPRELYDEIDAVVAQRRDATLLWKCRAEWIKRGYSPQNLAGWFFEWYAGGAIPEIRRPQAGGDRYGSRSKWPRLGVAALRDDDDTPPRFSEADYARMREEWNK